MKDYNYVLDHVCDAIAEFSELSRDTIDENTSLLGPTSTVSSRVLVEVLLSMEEFAEDELDAEFDWTSDTTLSMSKSIFRTAGTLAKHLEDLQTAQ